MKIEFRSHYFDDPGALASFESCTRKIFGLDFSRWKKKGLWDKDYTPFSAFINGECVASICVYPSKMKINGKIKKGAQLLTVGTLPEFRLKGIQKEIWKRAYNWISDECDFVFLFTDDTAAGFYEKLGLRRQAEYSEVISRTVAPRHTIDHIRKLDPDIDNDYSTIERLAIQREMVSNRLGFYNPNLLLFMFLYNYRDKTYYIESLDTIIVIEQVGYTLRIHDIAATKMPGLKDFEPFLGCFSYKEIEFLFCTDRLMAAKPAKKEIKESVLFVSDDFNLEGEFIFPSSIRA